MANRTLTITLQPDWKGALREAAREAFLATAYQGETLNFDSPAPFFGHLNERRWALIHVLQAGAD